MADRITASFELMLGLAMAMVAAVMSPALGQAEAALSLSQPIVSVRKIFIMLFLMLGPIRTLVPFVNLTRNDGLVLRRRLATRAMLFSLAALALAGLLGRNILENFEISVLVLALTGGLILFLVALRTVLEQTLPPARLNCCHYVCHPRAGHLSKADHCQHRSRHSACRLAGHAVRGCDLEMDRNGAPGSDRRARSDPNRAWSADHSPQSQPDRGLRRAHLLIEIKELGEGVPSDGTRAALPGVNATRKRPSACARSWR
jgi:hypothetical protein